ncbi:aldehyde dehydrogenase family protein [Niveispirillum sp. BGYR6]|uniref:aldehyde dehydrogenase family protein n=1 Tax=Niveispirillum sp. BGYR6 TaxID=2971249 RepID=UPI0022B9646F|nr:aldehyde dehydrogenase family protein [Niveispirillum sp. BGYR6]
MPPLPPPDTTDTLDAAFARLRAAAQADPFPDAATRRGWLTALADGLAKRQDEIVAAIDADFGGRLAHETLFAEIFVTVAALRHASRHLKGWMKRRRRSVPLTLQPGSAWIAPQPLGVVGVIAPWNYPLQLALCPLAGILAAGNRVLLKPSELTPRTTALIADLLAQALPGTVAACVSGGPELGMHFAGLPLDHLLFTGSTRVGRMVMQAAAANLTPVTLELGGKSPALLLPDADIAAAAADIAYGKLTNAGQTCVAPDYVLLPRPALEPFLTAIKHSAARYFPARNGAAEMSVIFGARGRERAQTLLAEAKSRGLRVEPLCAPPPGSDLVPSAIIDPPADIALMREELFAPLLPIIPYDDLEAALAQINGRDRPLALYLFGRDGAVIDRVLSRTHAGGVSINDTLIHVAVDDLPFGGVGPSGMGRYHGRDGFDNFSHLKPVFRRGGPRTDRLIRPPLNGLHRKLLRLLIGR